MNEINTIENIIENEINSFRDLFNVSTNNVKRLLYRHNRTNFNVPINKQNPNK